MELPLPLDQLRFNIILRILITAYWISGIWNFIAFVPGNSKDDEKLLWYNNECNYSFRLISSLLFFLLWISQFKYTRLAHITMGEIFIIVICYIYLAICKRWYMRKNQKNLKELKEKRIKEISGKA